jgi:hypothetical protein
MQSSALLKLGGRLWAILLALTVLTHAVAPFESLVTVRHGSAFSAATAEMAVAPANRVQIQRAVVPMAPPPPVIVLAEPAPLELAGADRFWPPQTAPPAPPPLALRPAPRAPPLS